MMPRLKASKQPAAGHSSNLSKRIPPRLLTKHNQDARSLYQWNMLVSTYSGREKLSLMPLQCFGDEIILNITMISDKKKKDDCDFKTNRIATLQLLRFISHA